MKCDLAPIDLREFFFNLRESRTIFAALLFFHAGTKKTTLHYHTVNFRGKGNGLKIMTAFSFSTQEQKFNITPSEKKEKKKHVSGSTISVV